MYKFQFTVPTYLFSQQQVSGLASETYGRTLWRRQVSLYMVYPTYIPFTHFERQTHYRKITAKGATMTAQFKKQEV